uniref:Uncharacterized protein n=1 Tax=Nelumbo nucifera TaxID=4432 RepID=A0A822XX33_NELNU|nr:TPA_asm: hypothetical protein HUJ06_024788 [Nelumbo nucifera]
MRKKKENCQIKSNLKKSVKHMRELESTLRW